MSEGDGKKDNKVTVSSSSTKSRPVSDANYRTAAKRAYTPETAREFRQNRLKDNKLASFISNTGGQVGNAINWANTGLGNLIDKGFDNTLGSLIYNVSGKSVDPRKWLTGEDVGTGLSLAEDLGLFALSTVNPLIGLGALGVKSTAENADTIAEALSGYDLESGEELSDEQKALKGLTGVGNIALMMTPGLGALKGGKTLAKGLREAVGKDGEGALGRALERASTKNVDEAINSAKETRNKAVNDLIDQRVARESAVNNLTTQELRSGQIANPYVSDAVARENARNKAFREIMGNDAALDAELAEETSTAIDNLAQSFYDNALAKKAAGENTGGIFEDDVLSGLQSRWNEDIAEGVNRYSPEYQTQQELDKVAEYRQGLIDRITEAQGNTRNEMQNIVSEGRATAENSLKDEIAAQKELADIEKQILEIEKQLNNGNISVQTQDVIKRYFRQMREYNKKVAARNEYESLGKKAWQNNHPGKQIPPKPGKPPELGKVEGQLKAEQSLDEMQKADILKKIQAAQDSAQEALKFPDYGNHEAFNITLDKLISGGGIPQVPSAADVLSGRSQAVSIDDILNSVERGIGSAGVVRPAGKYQFPRTYTQEGYQKIIDDFLGGVRSEAEAAKKGMQGTLDESARVAQLRKEVGGRTPNDQQYRAMSARDYLDDLKKTGDERIQAERLKAAKAVGEQNDELVRLRGEQATAEDVASFIREMAENAPKYQGINPVARYNEGGFRALLPGAQGKELARQGITEPLDEAIRIGEIASRGAADELTVADYQFINGLMTEAYSGNPLADHLLDVMLRGKSLATEEGVAAAKEAFEAAEKSASTAIKNTSGTAGRVEKARQKRQSNKENRRANLYEARTGPRGVLGGIPADALTAGALGTANYAAEVGPENAQDMFARNPGMFAQMMLAGLIGRPFARRLPGVFGRRQYSPTGIGVKSSNLPYRMMMGGQLGAGIQNEQLIDSEGGIDEAMANVLNALNTKMPQRERGYLKADEKKDEKKK